MDAAPPRLRHADLTRRLIGLFYDVYRELGGGFAESVYANACAIALRETGLPFERETAIPIRYHGELVGTGRPDLIVAGTVIVECKAVKALEDWHTSQVLHYLRASGLEVALLLNFGPRASFKRVVLEKSNG
jgi:GxxExxY protein